MTQNLTLPVLIVGLLIGLASASLAGYLALFRRNALKHKSSAVGTFSAGILVGLSLLSMLPDAMDTLRSDYGWSTAYVMLIFICAAAGMFLLEHVIFTHEHVTAAALSSLTAVQNSASAAEPEHVAASTALNDAALAAAAAEKEAAAAELSMIEMACVECEEIVVEEPAAAAPPPPRHHRRRRRRPPPTRRGQSSA